MCDSCNPNWEPPAPGEGETFDAIADTLDAKRHTREREARRAAGIPEPTLAELAATLGSHQPWNCPVASGRCEECGRAHRAERVADESRAEREYDARWSA